MNTEDNISRRDFLKKLGIGSLTAVSVLTGCNDDTANKSSQEINESLGQMTYRTDAHGQKTSLLGFGCMRLPTTKGVSGREDADNNIDQEEVNRMVDYAIEHGVNLFDTSPAYCQGRSEKAIGIALSRHKRSEYLVSTKLSNFGVYTREASLQMYHDSFKMLQVDTLDYYLLHSVGGGSDPFQLLNDRYINNGMLDFLLKEREAGKIKNLGFSYHGDIRIFDYLLSLHDEIKWDFVLIQLNYVDWRHAKTINPSNTNAEYLYEELEKRNIPAIVMEPLLGGRLAKLNDHATSLLKQKAPNASIASWAFRYCGSKPNIISVLSGMTYMDHLKDNLKTYSPLKELNEDEYKLLESIAEIIANYPTIPCTSCQYCMPCPYGIDIPSIFAHFNSCINEGYVQENRQDPNYTKSRKAFLVNYDRRIEKNRQADHCIGCKRCIPACPQQINIPKEMERINQFVELLKCDGAELGSNVLLAGMLRKLDEGNYSCVVTNRGITRTYGQKGIRDLYQLTHDKENFLEGALFVDKIIGVGAATLILEGGVKEVRTHVICTDALALLQGNNIKTTFDTEVEYIQNREKNDWCPLEKRLKGIGNQENRLKVIEQFVNDLNNGKL